MHDITLHQNINPYNKLKVLNNISSKPQKKYWLNNSASSNKTTASKKDKHKAAILFTTAIGLLFLSKGVQKKSKNFLENIKEYLERKADKSLLKGANNKLSFYEYSIGKINNFIQKTESINNFNSLKDILFMKFMYKTSPTQKIHHYISKIFEHLSRKTVKKSYQKTQKAFDKMYKNFDELDNYILKHHGDEIVEIKNKKLNITEKLTKRELVARAKSFRESVELVVSSFIDPKTLDIRYNYMKRATSKLYSKFWDESFKGFWTKENKFKRKEMWQTFIASEQVRLNKTDLAGNAIFARKMLSYTDSEKKLYISEYLNNLNSIIPFEDTKGTSIINRIRWYIKDTIPLDFHKDNLLQETEKLKQHNIKLNPDENIAKIQLEDKSKNIKYIEDIITDSDEGEIQDMLAIYRKIAPFELSKSGTLYSVKEAVKSFDKSFKLETGLMFDKLRDLEIGSAPTDILTILISSAMIVRALENAHSKEERNTIMLKSGIPIIGAISVSLISATKLISGTKSVALGIISGIVMNRIGSFLANRKK